MIKKALIFLTVLAILVAVPVILELVAEGMWHREIDGCFAALGSGDTPLKRQFPIPTSCRAAQVLVIDLGTPNSEVVLVFPPPRAMWLSYMMNTADYDTYAIELSTREGVTRAHLRHGSD